MRGRVGSAPDGRPLLPEGGEAGLLHKDAITVSGETVWDEVKDEWPEFVRFAERRIRASLDLATDAEG